MNIEEIKHEFIKLKNKELDYIDSISKLSSERTLSSSKKLLMYRKLDDYKNELDKILLKIFDYIRKGNLDDEELDKVIIEVKVPKDFLSSLKIDEYSRTRLLRNYLGIDSSYKYVLTKSDIFYGTYHRDIKLNLFLNGQRLIDDEVYIFNGCYDTSEEDSIIFSSDDPVVAVYSLLCDRSYSIKIPRSKMNDFEKDKVIIHSKNYVYSDEVRKIFYRELLNSDNKDLMDIVKSTRKIIDDLNYSRSPQYKEKILFDKIHTLYNKVKGNLIDSELLFSGDFLQVLREVYKLPDKRIVKKEKVIKNNGKNSVIVIALTCDGRYIITFQNRIKDHILAEFPSGYIENNEDVIDASKRELMEETGYESDDMFILDEVFSSPGIDNSKTYIVVANNCVKASIPRKGGTELVNYGLFNLDELKYMIQNNIMNGSSNKLAFYSLISNTEDDDTLYFEDEKVICKVLKRKENPFE